MCRKSCKIVSLVLVVCMLVLFGEGIDFDATNQFLIGEREVGDLFLENSPESEAEPYKVIGSDSRTKVTTLNVAPYSAIALLVVSFPDGAIFYGTGFMISNHYMATAAHMLYSEEHGNASGVVAYFGVNGTTYRFRYVASDWECCEEYPTTGGVANDWGIIEFSSNVGTNTGYLNIGFTYYDYQLSQMHYTICGYPGDMKVENDNGIDGYARYMYKATSSLYGYTASVIRYTADTNGGQSGSPVYNSDTFTVYAIHSGWASDYNQGVRITQSLYNEFLSNGWIN